MAALIKFRVYQFPAGNYTSKPISAEISIEAAQRALASSFKQVANARTTTSTKGDTEYVTFTKQAGRKGASNIALMAGHVAEAVNRASNTPTGVSSATKEIIAAAKSIGIEQLADYDLVKQLVRQAKLLGGQITNSDAIGMVEVAISPDHHALAERYARMSASRKTSEGVAAYAALAQAHALLALTEVVYAIATASFQVGDDDTEAEQQEE